MRIRILLAWLAVAAPIALAQSVDAIPELSGTYRTTIAFRDLVDQDFSIPTDLVGSWTVTIREDGHVVWAYASPYNSYEISTVYVLHDGRFLVGADTGPYRCSDYGVTSGAYTWSWQDGELAFEAIEDRCPERRIILTAHPLAPVEAATD